MPTLASRYDRLFAASARGDAGVAHDAFLQIVGLRARREASGVPVTQPPRTVPMLRYGAPRLIDVLALDGGGRRVAKFEDLSLRGATALHRKLASRGLEVVRVGPYSKRFDVTVSDAARAPTADLYTVIASRGREAHAVADAERDRTWEGTRRAGLALGYPPCCVDAFVAVEQGEDAARDGINEAALRASYGGARAIPWEMNPLSVLSPVGFSPCRADCPEALAFARRVLQAVARRGIDDERRARQVLRRPILFFRFPVFYALDAAASQAHPTRVAYAQALPNDDGAAHPPALGAWQHDELGAWLTQGDDVSLDERTLEVRAAGAVTARWSVADARVPLLLRFVD